MGCAIYPVVQGFYFPRSYAHSLIPTGGGPYLSNLRRRLLNMLTNDSICHIFMVVVSLRIVTLFDMFVLHNVRVVTLDGTRSIHFIPAGLNG